MNGLVLAEREPDHAYLATKIGQLVVRLDRGETAQCTGLSFEVAPESDFAAMSRQLREEGVDQEGSRSHSGNGGSAGGRYSRKQTCSRQWLDP